MKKNAIIYASIHTYGLFKFFGGLAKGHPDTKDFHNAIAFVKSIL